MRHYRLALEAGLHMVTRMLFARSPGTSCQSYSSIDGHISNARVIHPKNTYYGQQQGNPSEPE